MTDFYDSPEIKSEHIKEVNKLEDAKSAMHRFTSAISNPSFRLTNIGEGIYAKPDENDQKNKALAQDLNAIRNFISFGTNLNNGEELSPENTEQLDYCFRTLVHLEYNASYLRRLRETSQDSDDGDVTMPIDMSLPGQKLGDVMLRIYLSNDKDGNLIRLSVEYPDRSQIQNPNVISEEPINLEPFEKRLSMLQPS